MKNCKGFTLIELLATIIIVALLLAIAVPTISKYIDQSKRKVYIATARQYVDGAQKKVANLDFSFFDSDTTYYVHINNIELNNNKQSPYAIWKDAYVAIIYDGISHYYYWISADESGHRINLTREKIYYPSSNQWSSSSKNCRQCLFFDGFNRLGSRNT